MEQAEYRMPATGEGWRHYKGGLYTIVGLANDQGTGVPLVVYTDYCHGLVQLPPLYVRPLAEFLAEFPADVQQIGVKTQFVQRFKFERDVGEDDLCPYIRPRREPREPCEYCGPGVRTGLPGNACENCMNTGLKNPTAEDLR
jgi:hypothetical protein